MNLVQVRNSPNTNLQTGLQARSRTNIFYSRNSIHGQYCLLFCAVVGMATEPEHAFTLNNCWNINSHTYALDMHK